MMAQPPQRALCEGLQAVLEAGRGELGWGRAGSRAQKPPGILHGMGTAHGDMDGVPELNGSCPALNELKMGQSGGDLHRQWLRRALGFFWRK